MIGQESGALHKYQHGLIAERMRGRSNLSRVERFQVNLRLNMTIVGHLRGQHAWRYQGPSKSIKDLVTIHRAMHDGDNDGS